MIKQPI